MISNIEVIPNLMDAFLCYLACKMSRWLVKGVGLFQDVLPILTL